MITAIILTLNEEAHIARCLHSLDGVASRIIVADTGSTDRTRDIATARGAEVMNTIWLGNQADTFNKVVEESAIGTPWVLRIDADEYLSGELQNEIIQRLPQIGPAFSGIFIRRRKWFCNKELRHGAGRTTPILRLVRTASARYPEGSLMDEKFAIPAAETLTFRSLLMENTLHDLTRFKSKHLGYARREAMQYIGGKVDTASKRFYYRFPSALRPWGYFIWRYFLTGGLLDGRAGWRWDTLQCLWYRREVEREIRRLKSQ